MRIRTGVDESQHAVVGAPQEAVSAATTPRSASKANAREQVNIVRLCVFRKSLNSRRDLPPHFIVAIKARSSLYRRARFCLGGMRTFGDQESPREP